MSGTVKLSEMIGEKDRRIAELEAENKHLMKVIRQAHHHVLDPLITEEILKIALFGED